MNKSKFPPPASPSPTKSKFPLPLNETGTIVLNGAASVDGPLYENEQKRKRKTPMETTKDLQALTLVGPTKDNLIPDPLTALYLDNQLFMYLAPKIDQL